MSEDGQDWIFINGMPMLCERKRIARQQKIETWLTLYQLKRELGLGEVEEPHISAPLDYVV